MSGNNNELTVYLGKHPIAKLSLTNDELHWHYNPAWQASGFAVSPHLPLTNEIPPTHVLRFLRNLLPEGDALDVFTSKYHLSKNNTFGLIRALGEDTGSALIMLDPKEPYPPSPSFRLITESELIARLDERDKFNIMIWDGKPRLSVAGVQEKINVVLNQHGELGFGEGSLCSTHLLKFERKALPHLVLNEYLTMQLAKQAGLTVANVKIKQFGKHTTLLIERFDRQLETNNEVKRRHLIDGCQALNLMPEYKYERNFGSGRNVAHIRDGVSLKQLFNFANQCENPAVTKQQILIWVLFNLLVSNYDAHGKNISFFVDMNGISLAPFYDLVNIKMYPQFDHDMAMALGDEFNSDQICAYQFADFADACQLSRSFVVKQLNSVIEKIRSAMEGDLSTLPSNQNEKTYFNQYKSFVLTQCERVANESRDCLSIDL